MIEVFNFDQRSPEWIKSRLGIPTASRFSAILSRGSGKTRERYKRQLASEIVEGEPFEPFVSGHTDRGQAMEAEALSVYKDRLGIDVHHVGFIRNGRMGASPDGLIGETGGLEIKTALPHIQTKRLKFNRLPPEYVAQVQGNMLVSERDFWDFFSYPVNYPEVDVLYLRVDRDEGYIKNLRAEIERFNDEVLELVEEIKDLPRW